MESICWLRKDTSKIKSYKKIQITGDILAHLCMVHRTAESDTTEVTKHAPDMYITNRYRICRDKKNWYIK